MGVGGYFPQEMAWMSMMSKPAKEVVVYRSVATDVFQNLALEEWLFKNVDFSLCHAMLLWRNKPCVVVGRHQNPWMEADIERCREQQVTVARRQSGGGAVYHDLGNFNCTIFTSKNNYNRHRNLQLLCDTVNHAHGNNNDGLYIGERHDVWYSKWKVSGSAAKLGMKTSYHHFTLLLDINMDTMHQVLQPHPKLQFSASSATKSVCSYVMNLCDVYPGLTYDGLCQDISNNFYTLHRTHKETKLFDIDPSCENHFPGINEIYKSLSNDHWVFNKTPNFTVSTKKNCTIHVHRGVVTKIDTPITISHQNTLICNKLIGSTFNDCLLKIN